MRRQFPPDERPFPLDEDMLPSGKRVLVLAPHPDDFDAVGVTMRRLAARGNEIAVYVVSGGASGVEDGFCSPSSCETKTSVREQEQRDSCAFFGLPPCRLSFLRAEEDASGAPTESAANLAQIQACVERTTPDMVFLPHGNDTNAGHRRAWRMLERVVRETGSHPLVFLNRDPKTIDMRHDAYAVFGEQEAAWKAELLRCHASQHQRNLNTRGHGFDERILAVNREIAAGAPWPAEYAEVFELRVL